MSARIRNLLAAGVDRSSAAVGLFDAGDRLVHANAAFTDAFGAAADGVTTWESMLRDCHRLRRGVLIETDDFEAWLERLRSKFRHQRRRSFESDLVDGRWLSVVETTLDGGEVLVIATDITALKANESTLRHAHEQAVQQSMTDALTGLHNRRFIFDHLDGLLVEARDMRYPLAVAMLDLDDFKQLNDRYGHSIGDRVLVHFAQTIRPQLRPMDLVGRVGGEEFLVVFPNATLDGARQALLRLHQAVADSTPVAEQPALRYTFSSGLTLAQPQESSDQLFHRADVALYCAKAEGRSRNVVHDHLPGDAPG